MVRAHELGIDGDKFAFGQFNPDLALIILQPHHQERIEQLQHGDLDDLVAALLVDRQQLLGVLGEWGVDRRSDFVDLVE